MRKPNHLIATLCTLSMLIPLAACVNPEEQARYNQNLGTARENFSQQDEQDCINYFKNNMNDPSSLQILGHAQYSQMFNGMAVYAIPIRAKNAFGGLIKSEILCSYSLVGSNFVFHDAIAGRS